MIRARIIAEGEVQKVGFRDLVPKVARRLGVKGYVENLRDGNVQILCEAEESILEGFIQGINVKEDFINVESVRVVEKCEATGEFEFFEIKHGELADELGERLGTAVEYARTTSRNIREMHEDVKGTRSDINDVRVNLKGSIENMRDEVKGSIKDMHEDLKGSIKDMHADLKGSIKDMHADLKGSITDMHEGLKDGIAGVQGEVKGMRHEMNERFNEMAERYDVVSAELVRTREELTKAVNALLKLIEKFIHEGRGA